MGGGGLGNSEGRLSPETASGRPFACVRENGGGEIRTRETLAGLPVFKTGGFDHSATPPESAAGFYLACAKSSKNEGYEKGAAWLQRHLAGSSVFYTLFHTLFDLWRVESGRLNGLKK